MVENLVYRRNGRGDGEYWHKAACWSTWMEGQGALRKGRGAERYSPESSREGKLSHLRSLESARGARLKIRALTRYATAVLLAHVGYLDMAHISASSRCQCLTVDMFVL